MNRSAVIGLTFAAALIAGGSAASAQVTAVGKKISTVSDVGLPGHAPAAPTTTPYLPVGVPSKYTSKKYFLSVTTTIQVECDGVDSLATRVKIGSAYAEPTGAILDTETNGYQWVTRKWFIVPENQGGPVVPAGATVTLEVSSAGGSGCAVGFGSMVVEAVK